MLQVRAMSVWSPGLTAGAPDPKVAQARAGHHMDVTERFAARPRGRGVELLLLWKSSESVICARVLERVELQAGTALTL